MRKTKIVATIGPASETPEVMKSLLVAGVNIFRFNLKHGSLDWHADRIRQAKALGEELGVALGILVDLQGPEIRIETPDSKPVALEAGQTVLLVTSFDTTKPQPQIRVDQPEILKALTIDMPVLIDDGFVELSVAELTDDGVLLRSAVPTTIEHRKGMNIPSAHLDLATLLEHDLLALDMAAKVEVDFIALSFLRTAADITLLREEMKRRGMNAHIIGKIENAQALNHLNEILDVVDGVMVARGDLGIEVAFEQLAYWQKTIISQCRVKGRPVITATQMLQSMITSKTPTRAEVVDVANAVFDGTDAIMLSGETAQGKYPTLAVETMSKIAAFNESKVHLAKLDLSDEMDSVESITRAAMTLISVNKQFNLRAIIIATETGRTARALARFRPQVPIIALTRSHVVRDQLCLSYGVTPFVMEFEAGSPVDFRPIAYRLKENDLVAPGQQVLFIHGPSWNQTGGTNTLRIETIE